MNTETLAVILTCSRFLFIQGLGLDVSCENGIPDSGKRILNGAVADPANFPFVVRLQMNIALCGGSIISNYFIMTAAHCLGWAECSAVEVFPSTWVRGDTARTHAAHCYAHEKWVDVNLFYDIALINTQDDLLADGQLKAIPLPAPGMHYPPGNIGIIIGWGKTEDKVYPDRLMRGEGLVEDWDTCNYKYKHAHPACLSDTNCPVPDIPNRSFCTQGQGSQPSGVCVGDSGGPIIIDGVVAGVIIATISVGEDCGIGVPSLHTNVADFLPWIYSFIEPNKDTSQYLVAPEFS